MLILPILCFYYVVVLNEEGDAINVITQKTIYYYDYDSKIEIFSASSNATCSA